MKTMDSNKYLWSSVIVFALLGVLAGILLLAIPAELLLDIIFVIMGIVTVISNVPGFAMGVMHFATLEGKISTVLSLISCVVGFVMIFWHTEYLMFFLGAYLILMPLIEVLFSKTKWARFKAELPKLILGAVMILVGPFKTLEVLLDVAGWVIIGLTVIYVVSVLIGSLVKKNKKADTVTGGRIFADTDGDGKIDTVYTDVDGDGKADIEVKYEEDRS